MQSGKGRSDISTFGKKRTGGASSPKVGRGASLSKEGRSGGLSREGRSGSFSKEGSKKGGKEAGISESPKSRTYSKEGRSGKYAKHGPKKADRPQRLTGRQRLTRRKSQQATTGSGLINTLPHRVSAPGVRQMS